MKYPEWLPESNRPQPPERRPRRVLRRGLVEPVVRFLQVQAASGIVLLAATALALVLANSIWSERFHALWQTELGVYVAGYRLAKPLVLWINDGLMTIFFFVVGLEIKREVVFGDLREPRQAVLPVAAAIGGMVVPAGIYYALQAGEEGSRGWGIPMATDIAFVVGFLALLGRRIPFSLKILLLTLAIVDDIGAILVIAIAYSDSLSQAYLALAAAGFATVLLFQWLQVRQVGVYVAVGMVIWFAFLKSGVHPTVAGVALGLLTPARPWLPEQSLEQVVGGVVPRLPQDRRTKEGMERQAEAAQVLTATARESVSPLERLEGTLHPWVAFLVMPLFALANAGVAVELDALVSPVAVAVAAGLLLGKPIGIVLFSWLAVRVGLARLPRDIGWGVLTGGAALAGIGFTMSLFIAGLALDGGVLTAGKIGTLVGSGASAVLGTTTLLLFARRDKDQAHAVSQIGS